MPGRAPKPPEISAFAYIIVGTLPDGVREGQEQSFLMPEFSNSFAIQPFCKLVAVVNAPGYSPEALLKQLTGAESPKPGLVTRAPIDLMP